MYAIRSYYGFPVDDLELLRRHEPILRFNRVELFLPSDVGAYVRSCSLWERGDDNEDIELAPVGSLDIDRLAAVARERMDRHLHLVYVQDPLSRSVITSYSIHYTKLYDTQN